MRRRFLATVPVGAALETPAASNLCAPTRPMARTPAGNAKTHSSTRHRARLTMVSSTSSFRRRRRRRRGRLLGRQAAGRGSTFGAGCAAGRAASAPSPPHLHAQHARALNANTPCSIRAAGTSWPDLGVRSHLLRSARASRRAAKGPRRSMASGEIVVSRSVLRPIASDAPGAVEPAAAGWMRALVCARRGSAKKV